MVNSTRYSKGKKINVINPESKLLAIMEIVIDIARKDIKKNTIFDSIFTWYRRIVVNKQMLALSNKFIHTEK